MFEWNGLPQPEMVGFCDLVGVGIAPVSKKPAVNRLPWFALNFCIYLFFVSAKFNSYLPSPECSTDEKDMIASNSGNWFFKNISLKSVEWIKFIRGSSHFILW